MILPLKKEKKLCNPLTSHTLNTGKLHATWMKDSRYVILLAFHKPANKRGVKFYNDLAGILVQFKEVCKTWSLHRNQELQ